MSMLRRFGHYGYKRRESERKKKINRAKGSRGQGMEHGGENANANPRANIITRLSRLQEIGSGLPFRGALRALLALLSSPVLLVCEDGLGKLTGGSFCGV